MSYKVLASSEDPALSSNKGQLLFSNRGNELLSWAKGFWKIWEFKLVKPVYLDSPIPSLRLPYQGPDLGTEDF